MQVWNFESKLCDFLLHSCREDQPQDSTVTKDVHSGEILGNLEVMSFASEEQLLPFKCTRSRLQNSVSVKEARIVSESDALPGDSDFRFQDGVRCQLPLTVHQIATRSATGRLVKRPKKDLAIQKSPPRKQGQDAWWFLYLLIKAFDSFTKVWLLSVILGAKLKLSMQFW